MALSVRLFAAPFFSGSTTAADVPGRFDCALNGRGYMIDTAGEQAYTRRPIQMLRAQADGSASFGEQTLSPEELSRRSQDSWDHGAGQTFLDRADSDNRRFRSSKGIDVWERWALKLLPATASKLASASTNLSMAVAGSRLYLTDGTNLRFTPDLTSWTVATGTPSAATGIASDGFNVYTAHGSNGVYKTNRGVGAATSLATGTADVVGYCLGRLMVAAGASLFNVTNLTGPAALPAALFTHGNTDWRWTGFASGQSGIYAAGYSGDKSAVYRITIKADGTGLDQPTVAATLLDGEIVTAIDTYVGGIVLVGTSKGVRFGIENGDGTIQLGGYIATSSPVLCFEPQDEYVWYGLSNYDSVSTGLGRLHPTVLVDLTPAYASDLMATGQGAVTSAATFLNTRLFAVSGVGVFQEQASKVSVGTLDTGLIGFGIPDNKVAMFCDVKVRSAVDTNRAYISVDGSTFDLIGTRSTTSSDPFQVGEQVGETFEIRHELVNADADPTAGPIITRYTLRAYPNPHQGEVLTVPIRLFDKVDTRGATPQTYDVTREYEVIRLLQQSRQLVAFQIGDESLTVLVDDHQFNAEKPTKNGKGWQGSCVLRLKALAT